EKSKFELDLVILFKNFDEYQLKLVDLNPQILFHNPNLLPSLTFPEDVVGDYSMIKFKRLLPPYDSNCFDYENSKSFKNRGQCINDCVFKKILKKYDCIPRKSVNVLTLYDNMTLDSTFCVDNNFEGFSEDDCSHRCLMPCDETFFICSQRQLNQPIFYIGKHMNYINKIYMTFIYFMSSIGGLLGLWNN